MVTIRVSKEIPVHSEKVWSIIQDIDNEPVYWHGTKSVRNIRKTKNIVEREVVIAFNNSKCLETVEIDPNLSIKITITEGPFTGKKTITLKPVDTHSYVEVVWDIKLRGFLGMFSGMVKKHITEGTEQALERIAIAAKKS